MIGSKLQRTAIQLAAPSRSAYSSFRVLTWNILADGLAQNGDFVKVPPEVLEWNHRMPLVLAEILESGADIVCIQELNHFDELSQKLEPLGYTGVFHAKSCSPAERYRCPADGLAIFHRTARFTKVGDPKGSNYCDDDGHKHSQGYLQVRLRDEESGRELVVVTTHLKAKEGAAEDRMRSLQMQQLLGQLSRSGILPGVGSSPASNGSSGNGSPRAAPHARPAVVIAGDFNTTPESRVCQDLKQHPGGLTSIWDVRPDRSAAAQPGISSANVTSSRNGSNGNGVGGMSSESAGGSVTDNGLPTCCTSTSLDDNSATVFGSGTPKEFSTWKFRSKGESKRIIDHMWFTSATPPGNSTAAAAAAAASTASSNGSSKPPGAGDSRLQAVSRWRMLTEAEIGPGALPCKGYASDHLSLCVEFQWFQP